MKHITTAILLTLITTLLTGCSLSLEDVQAREAACRSHSGKVVRVVADNSITNINCIVDGAEYWVAPSGELK
jgi:hypothetical protein